MKILQINCVYGSGSTGRLVQQLHRGLTARGCECRVLYGRGALAREENVRKVTGELYAKANGLVARIGGQEQLGCALSTGKILRIIKAERPDAVHLHGLDGHFVNGDRLLDFLKREEIPTVLTLHAENFYTAGCSHAMDCNAWQRGCPDCGERAARAWERRARLFRDYQKLAVVAVSPWQRERVRLSPFFREAHHEMIPNGVDTEVFHPYPSPRRERKTLLYVTPHFTLRPGHSKGGEYLPRLAERLWDEAEILVVGPGKKTALPENVRFLGPIWEPEALARLYASADATLLLSRRETFSLVCAESLCCGTPVAGFQAGGPESIALPGASSFVSHGDLAALCDAVTTLWDRQDRAEIAEAAAAQYDKEQMVEQYLALYRELTGREG